MPGAPEDRPEATLDEDEDRIVAYLEGSPDFLLRHPELLQRLTPPSRFGGGERQGGVVVDMQGFMVSRLQADLARARDDQHNLILSARSNLSSQTQIHEAVLSALDARSFEHFIHIVTHDFPLVLDVDAVTLCVESGSLAGSSATSGVYVLPVGGVDATLGEGCRVLLREAANGTEQIFGPAAALVVSDALVRLAPASHAPVALLALGSREKGRFHPGQGTELLSFLAGVLERCLRHWLELPVA